MASKPSVSDGQVSREFYLPDTSVLSTLPGRIERTLTDLLRNHDQRSEIEDLHQRVREFYLPATPSFRRTRK